MRRVVVPLGVVCSVSHLVLAPVHGAELPLVALLTVLTAVACLFHLGRLWRAPSRAGWCWTAALAAVMVAHAPLVDLLQGAGATGGHGASASGAGPADPPDLPLLQTHHGIGPVAGSRVAGSRGAGSTVGVSSFDAVVATDAVGTVAGALQIALCLSVLLTATRARGRHPHHAG